MEAQPKNYILSVFLLVALVVVILVGLKFADSTTGELNLKSMNLFSQVEKDSSKQKGSLSTVDDPSLLPPPGSRKKEDMPSSEEQVSHGTQYINEGNRLGVVRFNDYSEDGNGLHSFFEKLHSIKSLHRPVRIAFFGDSFIEGDIFSGDLRLLFQENFGGKGVGMMPVTSQVNGFRNTVIHQFSAWDTYSFNNCPDKSLLGISGSEFTPQKNAWVYYQGVNKDCLDSWSRVSVFYTLPGNDTRIFYKRNKGVSVYASLPKAENVGRVNIDGNCSNIQISFPPLNNLHVYGVSLEDTTGVLLDNYSIRGFSGTGLQSFSREKLSQFNDLLHYDLIILGYGLNVTEAKRTDYETYETEMIKTINYLKASFPDASILSIGVPDRSYKENGDYKTMPGILSMIEHQKDMCKKTGIVFWNLFEAMGGENSMPLFVNSNPSKANKDYTHLTFAGGEYLGNLLYETFMYEKEAYEKKSSQAMVK